MKQVSNANSIIEIPALIDLHTHFRQPGFTEKETIMSGAESAYYGGFRAIVMMPNTDPAFDNVETVTEVINLCENAEKKFPVKIFLAIAMTEKMEGKKVSEILSDFDSLSPPIKKKIVAISEDGKTLQDKNLMMDVCKYAKKYNLPIFDHCEPETEIIKRDIELCKEFDVKFHIQHISQKESVEMIKEAKVAGLKITCETAPHYFSLTENDAAKIGPNAKMNPSLKSEDDRLAIIEGLKDGTIDAIATDHAPHEDDTKLKGANGIIGLETSFPISYTFLVRGGQITFERLIELMSTNPAKIIEIKVPMIGVDIKNEYKIEPETFKSRSRNTPFEGFNVYGRVVI